MKSANSSFHLLPMPANIDPTSCTFSIKQDSLITVCAPEESQAKQIGGRLAEMLQLEHGFTLPVKPLRSESTFSLALSDSESIDSAKALWDHQVFGSEGYGLIANADSCVVVAATATGLLWGAMTLRQLIRPAENSLLVEGAKILDVPHYRWRGFQIDAGRAPNSMAQIKRFLRIGSALKLNAVLFREGDDELNAVRYRTNRLGHENPQALNMDQIAELVQYARELGITFIPEIESLGHSAAKRFQYPHLVEGGFIEEYSSVTQHLRKAYLKPCHSESYELLRTMYEEWFAMIGHPYVHLGMDEVPLPAEVQANHLLRLLDVVNASAARYNLSAQPMLWSDAPPTPTEWKGNVIRCLWSYADEAPIHMENDHLVRQGISQLAREDSVEPVFMMGGSASFHQPYSKSPLKEAVENLAQWAGFGRNRPTFQGLFAVQWGGNMLDDWVGDFAAAADVGWNPAVGPENVPNLHKRIATFCEHLPDACKPSGDEIDAPVWDGIRLVNGTWGEDLVARQDSAAE